ncbi:MAG: 30S ribosomal protein S18 [Brevinematales bacterium]|nr:30S ribosomal protein S18 [Brevinematales bacterium]
MSEEKIKEMEIENLEKKVLESAVTNELIEEEIKKEKEDFGQSAQISDKKKFFFSKKVCKFCSKQVEESAIDYKNVDLIKRFTMPSGRILPRRISGNCARHQKLIAREIKKARIIALLPFLDR